MLRSVIESELECKEKELQEVKKEIIRLNNLIQNFKQLRDGKLKEMSDITYEISELKDELEEL